MMEAAFSNDLAPYPLRVEFLLKTDNGCPKDAKVTLITMANGQLHQSPPSPVPGDQACGKRSSKNHRC